jgi:hypothetical protein
MDLATRVALGGTAAVLLAGLGVLLFLQLRGRRRLQRELDTSRRDLAAVQARLDTLARQVTARRVVAEQEYLITDLPDGSEAPRPTRTPDPDGGEAPTEISASAFVSLAVGESLVRLLALGHGVRHALAPENRNRIAFEMRREVKRSRKQRRQEMKEARRHLRATQRDEATGSAA